MNSIIVLDKQVGETPLQCMNRFQEEHSVYQGVKMTYAGRLDPMAEGVLLVLAGDQVHQKEDFLSLPKTYICTAIIGVATDTYDILGIPKMDEEDNIISPSEIDLHLQKFKGEFSQAYPPFSSKTIQGKQLHTLARQGEIEEQNLPRHTVNVSEIVIKNTVEISLREISTDIITRISKVTGDFRQSEIIHTWQGFFDKFPDKKVTLVTFSVSVSGGTYIRGIVNDLGKILLNKDQFPIGACIYKLFRESVGEYTIPPKT